MRVLCYVEIRQRKTNTVSSHVYVESKKPKKKTKKKNPQNQKSSQRRLVARSESWRWAKWVQGIKGYTLPVVK